MRTRNLILTALCASVIVGAAAAPALADDDWRGHEQREWREHAWREHERQEHAWREHAWREHEWRERYYPPVVRPPAYGYYAPPPVYYANPGYYR